MILCRPRLPQPRVKDIVERIHHRLRRPSSGSHEIDILRVARRGQMKRVEGRAAAKRERVVKDVVRKDRHQRAADDQILLDLRILRPRRLRPPFENVIAWNHRSISTSAFTNSFHASWRLDLPRAAPGTEQDGFVHVRAHVLLKRLRLATGSGQLQKVA